MKDQLHREYRAIFNRYQNESFGKILKERGYVFQYDENEKDADLLFIGINPSYTEHEAGKTYADSYTRDVQRLYFPPFRRISETLQKADVGYNGVCTHMDLLVHRETSQKFIDQLIKNPSGCHFIMPQLTQLGRCSKIDNEF